MTRSPGGPSASRASGTTSSSRVGALRTLSAPACSRLMSSRFSTSRVSRSSDSRAVASSSSRSSARPLTSVLLRLSTAAVADASGERRSWLTAASSAVRSRSASAMGLAAAAASASSRCARTMPAWTPNTASSRWSDGVQRVPADDQDVRRRPAGACASPSAGLRLGRLPDDLDDVPAARRRSGRARAASPTPSDSASWSRSSRACNALSPRSTLPATVARTRDSAWARAACVVRRAARSTMLLTAAATTTNAASAMTLSCAEMVNRWIGGVK